MIIRILADPNKYPTLETSTVAILDTDLNLRDSKEPRKFSKRLLYISSVYLPLVSLGESTVIHLTKLIIYFKTIKYISTYMPDRSQAYGNFRLKFCIALFLKPLYRFLF